MNKDIQRLFILIGFLGCIIPCLASESLPKSKRKVSNNSNITFLTSFVHKRLFIEDGRKEKPTFLDKAKRVVRSNSEGAKRYLIREQNPFLNSHPKFKAALTKHFEALEKSLDRSFNPSNPDDIFDLKKRMAEDFMELFDDDGKNKVLSSDELEIKSDKLAVFFELAEVEPNGARTINEVVDKLIAGPYRPMYNKKQSPGDYWILLPLSFPSFMAGWWSKGNRVPKNTPIVEETAEPAKQSGGLPTPPPYEYEEEEDTSSSYAKPSRAADKRKTNYRNLKKSTHLNPPEEKKNKGLFGLLRNKRS